MLRRKRKQQLSFEGLNIFIFIIYRAYIVHKCNVKFQKRPKVPQQGARFRATGRGTINLTPETSVTVHQGVPLNCYLHNGWFYISVTGGKRMLEPCRIRKNICFFILIIPRPSVASKPFRGFSEILIHKISYEFTSFFIF